MHACVFDREEANTTEVSDIDAGESGTLTQGDNSTLESKTGTLTNGSLEHSAGSGGWWFALSVR